MNQLSRLPLILLLGISCTRSPAPSGPETTLTELDPGAAPGKTADLILAGTQYPVSIKTSWTGDTFRMDLLSHGEPLESERYEVSDRTFALIDAAEEHFKPALPLLKFPLKLGDKWAWSGTMTTGGIARDAWSAVTTGSERLFLGGSSTDTVKVTADLTFGSGSGQSQLKRQLVFWFAPKAGIVKRQFGTASIRQPSNPP